MSYRSCSSTRLISSLRNCRGHHWATTSPITPVATIMTQHAITSCTGSCHSTRAQRRSRSTPTTPVPQIPSKSSVSDSGHLPVAMKSDGFVSTLFVPTNIPLPLTLPVSDTMVHATCLCLVGTSLTSSLTGGCSRIPWRHQHQSS